MSVANCVPLPGSVPLDVVAAELQERGLVATTTVVPAVTREGTSRACSTDIATHANWNDLASLRDSYGWTIVSSGATHRDITQMTPAGQRAESCGSLTTLEAHGHNRAWGLFGYPNNKWTTQIQTDVVSTCFAFGRTYIVGPPAQFNERAEMAAPFFQKTESVDGGRCNNPALSCYKGAGGGRYSDPNYLASLMAPAGNEWSDVQAYRFVTGARSGTGSSWDCTSPDWRAHWTSRVELYCWTDYLAALEGISAETVVTDPATVAEAWGRNRP
jgi:hypothetical protein